MSNSIANFTLSPSSTSQISFDYDGDGQIDSLVSPLVDTVMTMVAPLLPPSAFTGQVQSQRRASFTWQSQSPTALGAILSRRVLPDTSWTAIYLGAANAFTDTLLPANSLINFRLCHYNAGGNSPYDTLTLATPPLPAPELLSPPDSAILVATVDTLIWTPVADALHYLVQVAADSAFDSLIVDDSTLTAATYLLAGSTYGWRWWRVRAMDCVPNASAWTPPRCFRTLPVFSLTLTPADTLILIPATGGGFGYALQAANNTSQSQACAIWCMVTLPNGNPYGPVLGPLTFTLPGGFSGSRNRVQMVPGSAPAGNYLYHAYLGNYPDSIWAQDTFPFTKLTTGTGPWIDSWANTGEPFEAWQSVSAAAIPAVYSLDQNYPNPFNPTTLLRFGLPQAGYVTLAVYNLLGQKVATLVDGYRPAGYHSVTWDASRLSSGIYFCKMKAGTFTATQKMMLVK